jgi:hypothetical protein
MPRGEDGQVEGRGDHLGRTSPRGDVIGPHAALHGSSRTDATDVQRMLGLAVARDTKALRSGDDALHLGAAMAPLLGRPTAPRYDHDIGRRRGPRGHLVVEGPDRILHLGAFARIRCTPGEEVDDDERAIAPRAREADAPADGRVVALCVGGRRVEHDPHDRSRGLIALTTRERVPVVACRVERCVAARHLGEKQCEPSGIRILTVLPATFLFAGLFIGGMAVLGLPTALFGYGFHS